MQDLLMRQVSAAPSVALLAWQPSAYRVWARAKSQDKAQMFSLSKETEIIPEILTKILDTCVNGVTLTDPDLEDAPIRLRQQTLSRNHRLFAARNFRSQLSILAKRRSPIKKASDASERLSQRANRLRSRYAIIAKIVRFFTTNSTSPRYLMAKAI